MQSQRHEKVAYLADSQNVFVVELECESVCVRLAEGQVGKALCVVLAFAFDPHSVVGFQGGE